MAAGTSEQAFVIGRVRAFVLIFSSAAERWLCWLELGRMDFCVESQFPVYALDGCFGPPFYIGRSRELAAYRFAVSDDEPGMQVSDVIAGLLESSLP